MRSLAPLLPLRNALVKARNAWWNRFWGMDIHPTARISFKAHLDKTYPVGIHIGEYTTVTFGVAILAHDMARSISTHTRIGKNCFIGAHSIILPGVTVGDGSIVAAGAVVNRDVPPGSIVAGNPAKIIKEGIETVRYGVIAETHHAAKAAADEMRARKAAARGR
jgi:acetyltransferase-like isoleucine patch superfamily enzyme